MMSDIRKLIKEYEDENCNFANIDWVVSASLRMSTYKPVGQSDCFLYTLANEVKKLQARIAELEERIIKDRRKAFMEYQGASPNQIKAEGIRKMVEDLNMFGVLKQEILKYADKLEKTNET